MNVEWNISIIFIVIKGYGEFGIVLFWNYFIVNKICDKVYLGGIGGINIKIYIWFGNRFNCKKWVFNIFGFCRFNIYMGN